MRLFVGYFFMETGWAKIHNLDAFTTRFAGMGSSLPRVQRRTVRVHGIPRRRTDDPWVRNALRLDLMIINMIVAILTGETEERQRPDDFAELDEPLYALSFVWLFFSGAGWLSVDFFLREFVYKAISRDKSSIRAGARFVQLGDSEAPHIPDR